MTEPDSKAELDLIAKRYARRTNKYPPLSRWMIETRTERERALSGLLRDAGYRDLRDCRIVEVGCGSGDNLLMFLNWGVRPENLIGNELLPARAAAAVQRVPKGTQIIQGNAAELPRNISQPVDIVFQSLVFTSILSHTLQNSVARAMWSLLKPNGGVLWYDFIYDNPKNADVSGVSYRRIRELFPEGAIRAKRATLAPPISRAISHWPINLYPGLNLFWFLRTHLCCWIQKRE